MKNNKFKKAGLLLLIGGLFASCTSTYEAIGNVSVLSNRPIKSGVAYEQLTFKSGGSKKELKRSKAESIGDAVKQVISKVPGGRFITNVTIYVVNDGHYAVSGNVWGVTDDSVPHANPNVLASDAHTLQPVYLINGTK